MRGYTTDYVNLIADNLRDRYQNGFPILKELIQNADDAEARRLIFGNHSGFPDTHHQLLKGPGLWIFNDGKFTESDAENLRSFGISGRAGDPQAIGKFGLGMKSVFHLCEALFYVAKKDDNSFHCEGLTPWKTDGRTLHQKWKEISPDDWKCLKSLGKKLAADSAENRTWFLLWLPLRKREHLRTSENEEIGCIIRQFPGDNPERELAFLYEKNLAYDLAEILPLLRHLERIEHKGRKNAFVSQLSDSQRLLASTPDSKASGKVYLSDGRQALNFFGLRTVSEDSCFDEMRELQEWPRSRYRDSRGFEQEALDQSKPEAAVLFYSRPSKELLLRIHWAVFLPVEDHTENQNLEGDHGKRAYSLVLHSQFFLDAGRKKIHDQEHLDEEPKVLDQKFLDESSLRKGWNRRLAQKVLLPLVLPALKLQAEKLSERECTVLTKAIRSSELFTRFQGHICRNGTWLRTLQRDAKPRWRLITGDCCSKLRPLPNPPKPAPERPWQVFPKLSDLDVIPYDKEEKCLSSSMQSPGMWQKAELDSLLIQVDGLFGDSNNMGYLNRFLESCVRKEHRESDHFQRRLLDMMREGFLNSKPDARRKVATRGSNLIGFLNQNLRLEISANLPELILNKLWKFGAPILLVPNGMDPEPNGVASPDEKTLGKWLYILNNAFISKEYVEHKEQILQAIQVLLLALPKEKRRRFLIKHRTLQIIKVREVRNHADQPQADTLVSYDELNDIVAAGTLFRFAGGLREERMGITPLLARVIPDATVYLISSDTCKDTFGNVHSISYANDEQDCLATIGQYYGRLGEFAERRSLLKKANNPGTNDMALRGLRFLLHGSLENIEADNTQLWVGRHRQHLAWSRLWENTHRGRDWSLIRSELVDVVPRDRWQQVNIAEIDAETLIEMLRRERVTITKPEAFSPEDRNEILSKIQDKDRDLWCRLPLHWAVNRCLVSVTDQVYLLDEAIDINEPLAREATLIRLSDNVDVANRQRLWIRPLDHVARIEIALNAGKPEKYWREVMDAVNELPKEVPNDLQNLLRNSIWLPTTFENPVSPKDVINLREDLEDEAHLIVERHRNSNTNTCYAVPDELSAEVRDHKAWELIRDLGFSAEIEGLDLLAQLLEDLQDYHIGDWQEPPADNVIRLLADYKHLPGWRLLRKAANSFGPENAWGRLNRALSQRINVKNLRRVLDWLTKSREDWIVRKSAHDSYLKQLVSQLISGGNANFPPELKLAAAENSWQKAEKLCSGAHGVVTKNLLDKNQQRILRNFVCRANARGDEDNSIAEMHQNNGETDNELVDVLRDYFKDWDANIVPRPMIGLVLALLGRSVRDIALDYLFPHSFEWIVRQLPWRNPGSRLDFDSGFQEWRTVYDWMGDKTKYEALDCINANVGVYHLDDTVQVLNLLGDCIEVSLDPKKKITTLLIGKINRQHEYNRIKRQHEYKVRISFRSIDVREFRPEKLREILRATAESLYRRLYNQKDVNFENFWKQLDQSNQLEIGVARRLILDHIPFYLRQLSISCNAIERHLERFDQLRYRIAEAEIDNENLANALRQQWRGALDNFANWINRDAEVQQAVVNAVKVKLEQYQYDLSSILMELFQNADDAAVELGQFHANRSEGCQVPLEAQCLVVDEREDSLGFIHWGRPVNSCGPVGFNGKSRGYHRDLEKMLILSCTDKPDDEAVTGKFGLGFKSVLLASEKPRILSGHLAIRVVAGMLPQIWDDTDEQNARKRLRLHSRRENCRLPGTLIDLPGINKELRVPLLERFRQLAGILCVFGRAIRTIKNTNSDSQNGSRWQWQPEEICPGAEIGELNLNGDWDTHRKALCIRTDRGSVLMAIGRKGFCPLPEYVPALWVTAPTRESSGVGFAVNGDFDLDAGRGRLAGDPENNLNKARGIGNSVGVVLGELFKHSRNDWKSVRLKLNLATNLDPLNFWESIWMGLTKRNLKRDRGNGGNLSREVALAVLTQLCKCDFPRVVPNGLKGSLHAFSGVNEIRYELSGILLDEKIGELLGNWERFKSKFGNKKCVSKEIADILRNSDLEIPKLQPVNLFALIGLIENSRVNPKDAEMFGQLYRLTEDSPVWKSNKMRKQFYSLRFQSEERTWIESWRLLASCGTRPESDEPLRHSLAPRECRLHSNYYMESDYKSAVKFFRICRQRMNAPLETITGWVLAAQTDQERRNALSYLAKGELGESVAENVRGKKWLLDPHKFSKLREGLTEEQLNKLNRRLVPQSQVNQPFYPPGINDDPFPNVSLDVALTRLYEWWEKEGCVQVAEYRKRIFPDFFPKLNLDLDPETFQPDLPSWFLLLALGSFQSIGRTIEEQHSNFVRLCQEKNWWQILTECDPRKQPERWMGIIEEYAGEQIEDEKWIQWLMQFPKIYRLRRWLGDYIELFLSIERFEEPFSRDAILAPRSNPYFQGGSIDAPPLTRTLKVGFPFVVRELLFRKVIKNSHAVPHAYAPIERIRRFFSEYDEEIETSEDIYQSLTEHLDKEKAKFNGAYDIPLRIVSSNADLRAEILQ